MNFDASITSGSGSVSYKEFNSGKNFTLLSLVFTAGSTSISFTISHPKTNFYYRIVSLYRIRDASGAVVNPPTSAGSITLSMPVNTYVEQTNVSINGLLVNNVYKLEMVLFSDDQATYTF